MLTLEDLSHAEIAEVLGITENNVGVRLSRARKALKEALRLAAGAAPGYIIALRIVYVDYSSNRQSANSATGEHQPCI